MYKSSEMFPMRWLVLDWGPGQGTPVLYWNARHENLHRFEDPRGENLMEALLVVHLQLCCRVGHTFCQKSCFKCWHVWNTFKTIQSPFMRSQQYSTLGSEIRVRILWEGATSLTFGKEKTWKSKAYIIVYMHMWTLFQVSPKRKYQLHKFSCNLNDK